MVNTNSVVQKDGKEPPENILNQAPSPVPPARKGQTHTQGPKGKTPLIQRQVKESEQVTPIKNGHPSSTSQTVILTSPQQQQQKQQQPPMQTKQMVPQQTSQKTLNSNIPSSQNNSIVQGNHNNGAKHNSQFHPPNEVPQNPTYRLQAQELVGTNLQSEKKQPKMENPNSKMVVSKSPVDLVNQDTDVTTQLPGNSLQPQPPQDTDVTTRLPGNSLQPQPPQPTQQLKPVTNSPVPIEQITFDNVNQANEGTKPLAAQPIQQAKSFLGQHITRKISQAQPLLSGKQILHLSNSENTQTPLITNEKSVHVASSTPRPGEQKILPNDLELQITDGSESNSSEESSGQYPKSIIKVAQNVLRSPLVKTKRPRDISSTNSLSMPSIPTMGHKQVETITSSTNENNKIQVNHPASSHPAVMKIPPKYDSRGNEQTNDPPKLGDLLQRASKSCPSSPEIIMTEANVLPALTVIVTPATPIREEKTATKFINISQGKVTAIQSLNQGQETTSEVIQNRMHVPAVTRMQGGCNSTATTLPAKEATNIGGSEAEKFSILGRDEGLLTPDVPGQEPRIPGLITPPPSPPILSSLEEEERNQIAEDISETSSELGQEVTNLGSSPGAQLASERKVMGDGESKEKMDPPQNMISSVRNVLQQPSQDNTTTEGAKQDPCINVSSEDVEQSACIKVDDEGNCVNEGVVLGKITLGSVAEKPPRLDTNNNAAEYFSKLYGKELSSLEAKFEEQVQQLKLALSLKQEELSRSKAEAEKLLKQSEERSRREQLELKERSKKEQQVLKERLEREKHELEEKHRVEREERDKKELEERQKREDKKEIARKSAETAASLTSNTSNNESKDPSENNCNDEEKEDNDDEEESEAECNKRKINKLQMELLMLKQQNEEFEEMVREKHRRQIELELQIGEIGKEVTAKEAMVDSVKVELCYAKNETELTKARVKRMEEELAQYKEKVESLEQELDTAERELKRMEILQEKLQVTETKRNELQTQLDEVELERDEEIKIIQDALDEAAQEREELLTTFEKEIEKLNSVNAAREAQMLEDFEAKLLELEQQHKSKLEEKERQSEVPVFEVRRLSQDAVAESLALLAQERRALEQQLNELAHLKSYEVEAVQLRGVVHELQKAIRATGRDNDSCRLRERMLEEEIRSLRSGVQSRQTTLNRGKRQSDQEEIRQRIDKMKSELNSEWEDKLRSECSRLKGELDTLHIEEKHLAVESIKVQKEQELQNLKKTFENKSEEMNKEISTLKENLSTKDAFYHKELDEIRTRADRDLWEWRRKLQKLDESSYDRQQYLEDKHREDIERLREEYADKMAGMESQLSSVDVRGISDVRARLEKMHKEQMEHLEEQHRLSMERLRDELEAEKFQAAEDARVIVTKHHEYINNTLRDQLTEAITANTQYREEIDAIRFALSRREEVIRSLEEEIAKLRSSKGVTPPTTGSYNAAAAAGGYNSPSPFPHEGSQGSRSSQDRLSSEGADEDGHRASGLLGKVFGGGWFSGTKTKDNTSPGYNNSAGNGSTRRGSGLYRQAW